VRFEKEWHAAGPTVFAALAISLLLSNHTQEQVNDIAFWIGLRWSEPSSSGSCRTTAARPGWIR
jgi:hypothetical protein